VLTCTTISFALLALFLRWSRGPQGMLDSLSANAFGIYLLHYPLVAWLQYALLPAPLPGYAKGSIVIVTALAASWLATAALRRIAAVDRLIGRRQEFR
jgi:surface polysaccharide O-acyltransferase-like enzyme